MRRIAAAIATIGIASACADCPLQAQGPQVTVSTPLQGVGTRFSENIGTGWSVRGPGFSAQFGGSAAPPFGQGNAAGGLSGGMGFGGNGFSGGMNFNFGQSASTTHVSTVPMLTVTSGQPGFLIEGTQRPFVTGVVPVVGAGGGAFLATPPEVAPWEAALRRGELNVRGGEAGATRGAEAFEPERRDEIAGPTASRIDPVPASRSEREQERARREQIARQKAEEYLERGRAAEKAGKDGVARIYYRLAERHQR